MLKKSVEKELEKKAFLADVRKIRKESINGADFAEKAKVFLRKWYSPLHQNKTTHCCYWCEELSAYISAPMVEENQKVKNAYIFDLVSILCCPNCKKCRKKCYALTQERMYRNTFMKRLLNLYLFLSNEENLELAINNQLASGKFGVIRLHAGGEFFSQNYVDFWERIARKNPKVLIYTYTKTFGIWDFSGITSLKNINIVDSILPNGQVNFGITEKLAKQYDKLKVMGCDVVMCPCVHNPEIKCGKGCTRCYKAQYCLIPEHN